MQGSKHALHTKHRHQLIPLAAALTTCLCASAPAATIAVNDPGAVSVAGKCTLFDAVAALNTATAVNTCTAGNGSNDTIDLFFFTTPTAITFALPSTDGESALALSKPARITGTLGSNGSPLVTLTRSTVSGTPDFRLISTTSDLSLSGLAFSNGKSPDLGGAIYVSGYANLTLANVTVSGNYATTSGGGVSADCGNITLTNSSVSGNSAFKNGGGIYAANHINSSGSFCSSVVTLDNTTVSNNQIATGSGGGVYSFNGSAYADHATISGNSTAGRAGGGVYAYQNATLKNSTIANNSAVYGGGGVASQYVRLTATTVANNTATDTAGGIGSRYAVLINTTVTGNSTDGYGGAMNAPHVALLFCTITGNTSNSATDPIGGVRFGSYAFLLGNIVTGNNGDNIYGNSDVMGSNNIIAASPFGHMLVEPADTMDCNPQLGPLANNGGATSTMSLGAGSCAIDHGPLSPPGYVPSDQRGAAFARRVGAATDIGAFEVQANDRIFYDGFDI